LVNSWSLSPDKNPKQYLIIFGAQNHILHSC
jgi:hypothetical protein